jgi:hypothetical protein
MIPADSSTAMRTARSVRIALSVGLALVAIAIGVLLTRSPVTVAGTNSVTAEPHVTFAPGGSTGCQQAGTVPRGTSGVRLSFTENTGPSVTVRLLSGGEIVTEGERPAGWGSDETVTVPVKRVTRTIPNARICVSFGEAVERVLVNGSVASASAPGNSTGIVRPAGIVRLRIEYLRSGHTWWSLASTVAHRMGFGHAPSGTWIVFLLIALAITTTALASRLLLKELR